MFPETNGTAAIIGCNVTVITFFTVDRVTDTVPAGFFQITLFTHGRGRQRAGAVFRTGIVVF